MSAHARSSSARSPKPPPVRRSAQEVLDLLRPVSVYGQVVQHAADCAPSPVTAGEFREVVGPTAGTVLTMAVKRGNLERVGRSLYRYRPDGPHGGDARVLALAAEATSVSNLAILAQVGVGRVRRILALAGIDPRRMRNHGKGGKRT